jgi:DNA-binding transcriptional ArsR family regulator
MSKPDANSAPFSYDGLDRVIHEKARLGLLTSLMAHPGGLAFADLKQLCGLTDGNLSRHLAVLQDAGLVEVTKGYEGNRPHTSCRLTKTGRRRFLEYLAVLEGLVRDAAKASVNASSKTTTKLAGRDVAKEDGKQAARSHKFRILPA